MRLAIADPPYLGRANRWYGNGCGHQNGAGKPDSNIAAADYDKLDTHLELLNTLESEYDGWAYAGSPDYLPQIAPHLPERTDMLVWHRGNAIPNGTRLRHSWEFVIVKIPKGRRSHGTGLAVNDVLSAGIETRRGFVGAKPEAWRRWVLAVLGYKPDVDEVIDLFPGSGAVSCAIDGLLPL